jgi:hypothetical protein
MTRITTLFLAAAIGGFGCNPFAQDAPVPVQTPPPMQVGPNGVAMPGVQINPNGVYAPGVQIGPNGVIAPGVQVGPNGVIAPGVVVGQGGVQVAPTPIAPPMPGVAGGLPMPASFGVPACDAYAARACNCNNAMMRPAMCQSATQSFESWRTMTGPALAGLAEGCAMADQGIRSLCSQ